MCCKHNEEQNFVLMPIIYHVLNENHELCIVRPIVASQLQGHTQLDFTKHFKDYRDRLRIIRVSLKKKQS